MPTVFEVRRDPALDFDDRAVLAFLEELVRTECGPLAAAGGQAPVFWREADGGPGWTRGGIERRYGRVVRLPGAE